MHWAVREAMTNIRHHMNAAALSAYPEADQDMALYALGSLHGCAATLSAWGEDWYLAANNEARFLMYSYRKDSK